MKKLLSIVFLLASAAAHGQFVTGQALKAADLNAALAAPIITGGSINGATIGQTTPAAGKFTAASVSQSSGPALRVDYSDTTGFSSIPFYNAGSYVGGLASFGTASNVNYGYLNGGLRVDGVGGISLLTGPALDKLTRFDASGNLGLGVTPSAWGSGGNIELQGSRTVSSQNGTIALAANAYYNAGYKYIASDYASQMLQSGGGFQWQIAPSGTAGSPITWTTAMAVDNSGNLLVGVTSGSTNIIAKSQAKDSGQSILEMRNGDGTLVGGFAAVTASGTFNAGAAALYIDKASGTNRSINAAGTINASGADYAEYMRKAPGVGELKPGQIVGVDSDGNLTDRYSAAVSFLVVSTDPSYIGGDTWGSEKALGMAHPVQPASDATAVERAKYVTDKARFDALLALAQSRVAIIAYAGQVPVNVKGGKPGQYVVPARGSGDSIVARFVNAASMTFQQYRAAVGIVQNVLPDGRANVRVKVL